MRAAIEAFEHGGWGMFAAKLRPGLAAAEARLKITRATEGADRNTRAAEGADRNTRATEGADRNVAAPPTGSASAATWSRVYTFSEDRDPPLPALRPAESRRTPPVRQCYRRTRWPHRRRPRRSTGHHRCGHRSHGVRRAHTDFPSRCPEPLVLEDVAHRVGAEDAVRIRDQQVQVARLVGVAIVSAWNQEILLLQPRVERNEHLEDVGDARQRRRRALVAKHPFEHLHVHRPSGHADQRRTRRTICPAAGCGWPTPSAIQTT